MDYTTTTTTTTTTNDDEDEKKPVKKVLYHKESPEQLEKRLQIKREHFRQLDEQRAKEEARRRNERLRREEEQKKLKEKRDKEAEVEREEKKKEATELKRKEEEERNKAERFKRYKGNLASVFSSIPETPGVKKSVQSGIGVFFDSKLYFAILLVIVSVFGMFATQKILRLEKIDFLFGFEFVSYYLYFIFFMYLLTQTLEQGAFKTFVHLTCILTVANLVLTSFSNDIAAKNCDPFDSCFWYTGLHTPEVQSPVWVFSDPFYGDRSSTLTPEETENVAHRIWFSAISQVNVFRLWKDNLFRSRILDSIDWVLVKTIGFFFPSVTTQNIIRILVVGFIGYFGRLITNVLWGFTGSQFLYDLLSLGMMLIILFLVTGENVGYAVVNVLYLIFGFIPDLMYNVAAEHLVEQNKLNNSSLLQKERSVLPSSNSSAQYSQIIEFNRGGSRIWGTMCSFVVALVNPLFPGPGENLSRWLINSRGPRVVVWPRNQTTAEFFLASGLFSTADEFASYVEYMDGNFAAYVKVLDNQSKMLFYDELVQKGIEPSKFAADNYLKMFPYTSPFSFKLFNTVSPLDTCVPREALPIFFGMSYAKQLWLLPSCRENPGAFLEKYTKDIFRQGLMQSLIPDEVVQASYKRFDAREKFFFTYAKIETHKEKFKSMGFNIPPFPVQVEQTSFVDKEYLKSMVTGRKATIIRNAYYILDG